MFHEEVTSASEALLEARIKLWPKSPFGPRASPGWHGFSFDFAQGGLSTSFGWRLTSLRMAGLLRYSTLVETAE